MKKNQTKRPVNYVPLLNKKDICMAAVILTIALVSGFVFWRDRDKTGNVDGMLEITIDGELYGDFPLSEDREMVVASSYGNNTVVIEQGRAYVKEADCPDKICVGMQGIDSDGEIICCLPHRLFLTVRGESSGEYDAVAY